MSAISSPAAGRQLEPGRLVRQVARPAGEPALLAARRGAGWEALRLTRECGEAGLQLTPEEREALGAAVVTAAQPQYVQLDPLLRLSPGDLEPMAASAPALLERALRARIAGEVERFQAAVRPPKVFTPGVSAVQVSGRVMGTAEIQHLVEASLDGWLTTGRFNDEFERNLARVLGVRFVLTANSGSSANLLALSALTSPLLRERALQPGDEVIATAAAFPTTVNPILQHNLTPVFVDVEIPTYNTTVERVAAALTPRTRAIMLAHTLGNPYDAAGLAGLARDRGLWLVEDCCDALGSRLGGRLVGSFGDVASLSFYPAHHITMGEGGAVFTRHALVKSALESIRDWGRDCWCATGKENTCGKRFGWQLGDLPPGYDHKYIYSHLGYNLKITDLQAAVGVAQLARLPEFIAARQANFERLHAGLRRRGLDEFLVLPEATAGSEPAWFGFPLTLRESAPLDRARLVAGLEARRVATRLLFGGNLLRQPYFRGRPYRVHGELTNTDRIMRQTFWLGVFPGLDAEMVDYTSDSMAAVLQSAAEPGR